MITYSENQMKVNSKVFFYSRWKKERQNRESVQTKYKCNNEKQHQILISYILVAQELFH